MLRYVLMVLADPDSTGPRYTIEIFTCLDGRQLEPEIMTVGNVVPLGECVRGSANQTPS